VLPTDKIIIAISPGVMKSILIIDDNKDLLDALSAALRCQLKDCGIVTALDGAKGMNIMESVPIDLIVTDLAMPVMNGYLFIEYAKKHYPAIPVCVMTGSCSPQILEKLRSSGVGRCIKKPFQLDELLQVISEELRLEPQSTGSKSIGPCCEGGKTQAGG
jgi:two-component system capsular synthesis sensor histidine kinase RcsC